MWSVALQQVKTVGLHVQSLSQHPPHSHTRHLHDSHGAQISLDCEEKTVSLVPRFLLTHAAVLHFFLYKGTPLSETAATIP